MELEDQVCSLELAKKLKELGIEQESLFYYLNIDGEGIHYIYFDEHLPEDCEYEGDPISAFTVAELGEMLPEQITISSLNEKEEITKSEKFYLIYFKYRNAISYLGVDKNNDIDFDKDLFINDLIWYPDDTEANNRAKLLIYLIENRYINLQSLKHPED